VPTVASQLLSSWFAVFFFVSTSARTPYRLL
jgi:hypothetical protein